MKIIGLKIENIKRIKAVEIKTEGKNIIEITGKNGQGKSSIIDSIAYALGGKSLIPERPIRDGEESAFVEVDLGEFVVRRTFTASGSTIKVTSKDGFNRNSPQSFLDAIIGTLSFDPLAFTQMESKKRVDMFKTLAKINTDDLDESYSQLYESRTESGKSLKRIEAELDALLPYAEDVEVPDISDLQKSREEAVKNNECVKNLQESEARLLDKISDLEKQLILAKEDLQWTRDQFNGLSLIDNVDFYDEKIRNIQPLIIQRQKHSDYVVTKSKHDEIKKIHEGFQAAIDSNIEERKKILEEANMPVEGLSLVDNNLYFNKIPFEQLSQAEQLRISTAMAIAENSQLKIAHIKDGSLLDNDAKQMLKDMAAKHDFQIWMEIVRNEKPEDNNVIYIEDGAIA